MGLAKRLPFPAESFDAVYHSHLLGHIERDSESALLKECYRVLNRRGVMRVVVPDLQSLVNRYVSLVSKMKNGYESDLREHQQAIWELFNQMVRLEPAGRQQQRPLLRAIERYVRGDAAKIGELHRWMYDKYSLGALLVSIGLRDVQEVDHLTSKNDGWRQFDLDIDGDGKAYRPGSLYMEGVK